jgi:ADP-ribose pyrophosphatase
MHLLLAEGISPGEAAPEEDEKIVVAAYSRKELEQMMQTGKLKDAKSIAGLLFYFSFIITKITRHGS